MKIIGVSTSKGEFQGRNYHNLNIYVTTDFNPNVDGLGKTVETIKLRFANINVLLNLGMTEQAVENLTAKDFSTLIGRECNIYYNRFGGVESINWIENKETAYKK